MPIIILTWLVQLGLIVHVMKTGRNTYWIFALLMAPGLGGLAYLIIELLPDLMNDRRARSAARGVAKSLNPGAGLRQREREHKLSGSVDATRRLAEELVDNGRYAEAIELFESALKGLYEHDPDLLLGLAEAQFGDSRFVDSRETLERLIEQNPDFKSPVGHLLYARVVEACGDDDKALQEYKALASSYAGAEARLRYGLLLEKRNDVEAALAEYEEIATVADLAPRHYRKAQRLWINEAKSGVRRLKEQASPTGQ